MAAARSLPVDQVKALIERHINRSGVIIGAPERVNVLKLNLALDEEARRRSVPPGRSREGRRHPRPGHAGSNGSIRDIAAGASK